MWLSARKEEEQTRLRSSRFTEQEETGHADQGWTGPEAWVPQEAGGAGGGGLETPGITWELRRSVGELEDISAPPTAETVMDVERQSCA